MHKDVRRVRNRVAEVGLEYFCPDYVSKNGVSVMERNRLQLSMAAGECGCMGTGDCLCGDRLSESMSLVCEVGGTCLSELHSICTCGPLMGNLPHD